jgi:hypothetical protein
MESSQIAAPLGRARRRPTPRKIDPKRTRKAQRIVRRLIERGKDVPEDADAQNPDYSHWEQEFLSEVDARLDRYGSAFYSRSKGRAEEPLSRLQAQKLKEIAAKAKGKPRKTLRTKKPLRPKRPAK